jgi:hypothetical protein
MKVSPDELHARAGLVASEFSLLGLGASTFAVAALLGAMHGRLALPIVRAGLGAGAGLTSAGLLLAGVGRYLDLGRSRKRPEALASTWLPVVVLGALLTIVAWTSLALLLHAEPTADLRAVTWLVGLGAILFAVPLLAGLGLRSLGAVEDGAPMPIAQLFQSTGHCLLGGAALLTLIGLSSDALSLELKYFLGAALCTGCAHVILWSAWLLRGSRRYLRGLRNRGVRLPQLERAHTMASLALVFGLLVPGLLVLADLVTLRETGLAVACSVLAVSNHAMRYAWVLLPLRRTV